MNGFGEFVRSMGLRPREVAPDGKWRRCPTESHPRKRNGAYKLAVDGRIGWVQDWAIHESPVTWRPDEEAELPDYDPSALQRAWREQERKKRNAIADARRFYEECEPLMGGHGYLESHELDMRGCMGLKVDPKGWLVVPAYSGSDVHSVQRIAPDGTKRFWPGAPVSGTRYTIDRRHAVVTVLCEGLATGLACYRAVKNARVIVLWNTGNLKDVADVPPGLAVIAADNDHGTAERIGENPGIKAAQEAAEAVGCGVAYPEGIEGTDWSDYRQEGIAARMDRRGKYDTRSTVARAVDAEISRLIMSRAKVVGR